MRKGKDRGESRCQWKSRSRSGYVSRFVLRFMLIVNNHKNVWDVKNMRWTPRVFWHDDLRWKGWLLFTSDTCADLNQSLAPGCALYAEVHTVLRRLRRPRSVVHEQQDVRVGHSFAQVTQKNPQYCCHCNHRPWVILRQWRRHGFLSFAGFSSVLERTLLRLPDRLQQPGCALGHAKPAEYLNRHCWVREVKYQESNQTSPQIGHRTQPRGFCYDRADWVNLASSTTDFRSHPRFQPAGSFLVSDSSTLPDSPQCGEYGQPGQPNPSLHTRACLSHTHPFARWIDCWRRTARELRNSPVGLALLQHTSKFHQLRSFQTTHPQYSALQLCR